MAISGKAARIRYTAAAATSSTNNAATLSTDEVTLTINSSALRLWNNNNSSALKIFEGATNRTTDIGIVRWPRGQLVLDQARSTAATWTIDVETYAASFLTGGKDWSLDVETNLLEDTSFSTSATDSKWRTMTPGLNGASASISRFAISDTGPPFTDRIIAGQNVIPEFVVDNSGGQRYLGYARVTRVSPSVDIDGLAEEGVDLVIDGPLYYSTN
jgi:hypothetical protein